MEPNHNSFTGSSELPQPQEVSGSQPVENQPAASPETQNAPLAPNPATNPLQPITATPTPATQPQAQPDPTGSTPSSSTQHLIADDADLIEKEWVTKAKAIVTQTKDDPHLQNQEIVKVKADYLKKRYNKDLKVSEG